MSVSRARIKIKASSLKKVQKNLKELEPKALLVGKAVVKSVSNEIYLNALANVPKDTGALANSLFRDTEVENFKVSSVVGHGGEFMQINPVTNLSTDYYAAKRHEMVDGKFSSKWLEKASRDNRENYSSALKEGFGNLFDKDTVLKDDLPDKEHRVGPLNITGSKAYAYKQQRQGGKGRWVSLATD